jgi:hypothetical protein
MCFDAGADADADADDGADQVLCGGVGGAAPRGRVAARLARRRDGAGASLRGGGRDEAAEGAARAPEAYRPSVANLPCLRARQCLCDTVLGRSNVTIAQTNKTQPPPRRAHIHIPEVHAHIHTHNSIAHDLRVHFDQFFMPATYYINPSC